MGVDHSASWGYGFVLPEEQKLEFLETDDYYEALEKFCENYSELGFIEAGYYAYTGDADDASLGVVVLDSYTVVDVKYPDDKFFEFMSLDTITTTAIDQLYDAALALAIENVHLGFMVGVHTY